jgi:hydrogenase maturation protease
VVAAEVGTAVLFALHLFEQADKVLAIDAMQAGGEPGQIYAFGLDAIENSPVKTSLHDFGLRSVFEFLPAHRPEVLVLGVEPAVIDYRLTLSPRVEAALPRVVAEAGAIVKRWRAPL